MAEISNRSIYVVLHEDRHIDVEPYLFVDVDAAIVKARELCSQGATFNSDIEEHELTDEMERDGWLFYATYSTEGDSVTVLKRQVQ